MRAHEKGSSAHTGKASSAHTETASSAHTSQTTCRVSPKPRVIMGVTKTQSKQNRSVMDKIAEGLRKENGAKSEAIELRNKLLDKYQ